MKNGISSGAFFSEKHYKGDKIMKIKKREC